MDRPPTAHPPPAADRLPLIVWAGRADGTPLRVNARWAAYTGEPPPTTLAQVAAVVHPADRRRAWRAWERATGWGRPFRAEVRLRRADGAYRWFLVQGEPAAGGEWAGTAVDVHRLRRAGRAERRRRDGFRRAADAVAGIVYDFDPHTGRVTRHRGLFEVLGYRRREVPPTGAGWQALIHPDDRPQVTAAGLTVLPGTDRMEARYRVRHADGTWRHVLDRSFLVWDGDRLARLVGCTVDVTDETAAGDELRAADRRKDDRLAQIAHELRNPLAPIRTAVEAVQATPGLPPVARGAVDIIGRQARHLGRLVDDLLDVTRIARGQVRLDRERIDLRAVLHEAAESCRPQAEARGHALTVNLPADPLPLVADPGRLLQVFSNLLGNAVKYTPPGGRITLTATAESGSAVVRVSDTGLGLPADQLERVFEPFTQLDAGQESAAGGLGIGLALVRSLVGLHAGTVTAASPGAGCGSVFTVRLPLTGRSGEWRGESGETESRATVGSVSPLSPPHSPLRILVVDDHPDAADSLAGLLRLLGHTADVAADGVSGLTRVRELRPDVVLLDHNLPGLSGAAVAAAVRADPALAGVRLVAVSGDSRPNGPGFDAHLTKPVGVEELKRALAAAKPVPGSSPGS